MRKIVRLLAVALMLYCMTYIGIYVRDTQNTRVEKQEIESHIFIEPKRIEPKGIELKRIEPIPIHEIYIEGETKENTEKRIDFQYLKNINTDVVGYIEYESLGISYPFVNSKDNKDYIHTDINGNSSFSGTLFLDCRNQGKWLETNNLIYGHNMKNGTMFGMLSHAKVGDTFKIYLEDECITYKVKDIRVIEPDDNFYKLDRFYYKNTVSLSTCKGNKRLVVTGERK